MKLFLSLLIAAFIAMPNTILAISSKQTLTFIENKGQIKDQNLSPRNDIDFKLSTKGVNVFIGDGALHYQWNRPSGEKTETYRLDVTLIGANKNAMVITDQQGAYYEQYYITGCDGQTARSFGKITYKDVYPGIDWVLYIKNNSLEHEFIVHQGADASLIALRYDGASTLYIDSDGSLLGETPLGVIQENKPFCFDESGKELTSRYHLYNNTLSYNIEQYHGKLTIDPTIIWGTYFGGDGLPTDDIICSKVYNLSQIYIGGQASSTSNIATVGSHQSTIGGQRDAFMAKFDSSGNCIWATYYGGMMIEYFSDIDTDPAGNVYGSGTTGSNTNIATPGSHRPASLYGGIFLVKFNSAGVRQWGTYYGDFLSSNATGTQLVSCGNDGFLYLSGAAANNAGDIATPGSFLPTDPGAGSGYLVRFDTNGVRQWGTYYPTAVQSMDVDVDNNVYFMGRTSSTTGISTTSAHQLQLAGMVDNVITKFNTQGEQVWATYYGGDSLEQVGGMSWCNAGLYCSGSTNSLNNIATPGTYQPSYAGSYDAFLVLFDTSGQRIWGTYFGGPSGDNIPAVSSNVSGDCYMVGTTKSTQNIALPGAWQKKYGGGILDGYMVKFSSLGMAQWSTYYGGCLQDAPRTCANDGQGNIYIGGITESTNAIATPGSYQDTLNNIADAFLSRFNETDFFFTVAGDTSVCDGETVTYSIPDIPDAQSFTWSLPNGWQGSSSTNTMNATVAQPGGVINVYVQRTCTIDTFTSPAIVVHPLPQPVITQNMSTLSTTSFTTYQWYHNNTLISGATGQNHTATQDGNYHVIVTDANGCSNSSGTVTVTGVSVDQLENATKNILVFPNPAKNKVNISATDVIQHISLADITGREVYTATPLNRLHTIPLSFATGVYYIKIATGETQVIRKIRVDN